MLKHFQEMAKTWIIAKVEKFGQIWSHCSRVQKISFVKRAFLLFEARVVG